MSYTEKKAIIAMLFCTIFTSTGQLFWKAGILRFTTQNYFSILNTPFIIGCLTYGIGAVLLIWAMRFGELTILYPLVATSYVWVSLLSPVFYATDSMNLLKWIGILIILSSVSLLGLSTKSNNQKVVQE